MKRRALFFYYVTGLFFDKRAKTGTMHAMLDQLGLTLDDLTNL